VRSGNAQALKALAQVVHGGGHDDQELSSMMVLW
jgi:hypothetical protein